MDGSPKRSVRESITQLIVIVLLIAILAAAVILLRQYVDSHNNAAAPTPVISLVIPGNALTGYYEIVTTASQKDTSVSGGTIIEIRR